MNNNIKNFPLVSIIMNCYNGEAYLKESIDSILSQTYENWEVIFWDNRSEDRSAKIFKSYQDKRLKYFYSEEHTTLYKGRNLAIEKSKGDFIAFLDTDDIWDKKKLELQMHCFNKSEVGVVYSNYWTAKKNIMNKKIYTNKQLPFGSIFNELVDNYNIGILTTVIRKKFYLKLVKKFDERFSIIGDYDLFMRLAKMCLFGCVQKPLATYRLHDKNLSRFTKGKELEEHEIWVSENNLNLNQHQIKKIQKEIDSRKFINYKINGQHKEYLNILFGSKKNIFSIKNLIILFMPRVFLKKFLRFY
tara:strand:+ start:642 stop:1547 length:906 start_codon:yes stop_codon:yes gene_type:complete